MNEENKNNFENDATENTEEVMNAAETTEEVVEEVVSEENIDEITADEVVEEDVEKAEMLEENEVADNEAEEEADAVTVDANETFALDENGEPIVLDSEALQTEKKNIGKIVGIAVACVAVAAVIVLAIFFGPKLLNKYNRMGYIDTTGRTIGEVADLSGYELADFLAEYGLPADMPESTYESVAYYMIPASKVAEMYGMDFASLKEMLGWDDSITEETPWGEAEGETTLSKYIGEGNLSAFKEEYGFGDEVTAETKWKEIRNTVDQYTKEERIAAEKEEAEAREAEEADLEAEEDTDNSSEATEESAGETAESTEASAE